LSFYKGYPFKAAPPTGWVILQGEIQLVVKLFPFFDGKFQPVVELTRPFDSWIKSIFLLIFPA
jgi:hypothetical protein